MAAARVYARLSTGSSFSAQSLVRAKLGYVQPAQLSRSIHILCRRTQPSPFYKASSPILLSLRNNSSVPSVTDNAVDLADVQRGLQATTTSHMPVVTAADAAPTPELPVIPESFQTVVDPLTTEAMVQAAHQIGDLKAMGLVHWTPVGALEGILELAHVYTGLPWWGTIAAVTIGIRFALFPLFVKVARSTGKLAKIRPQMDEATNKLKNARAEGDLVKQQEAYAALWALFKTANPLSPLLLPALQIPVMMSFFLALRAMADLPVPGFQTGGTHWFLDLTAADPYVALPCISAALTISSLRMGSEVGHNTNTKAMINVFQLLAVLVIPFVANLPAAVFAYWVPNAAFSVIQTVLLRNPNVRKKLHIPALPKPPAPKPGAAPEKPMGFFEGIKTGYQGAVNAAKKQYDQAVQEELKRRKSASSGNSK
ncbi:hypothetical protein SAICODRAFT_90570 [Saitoella complicata NRRL Y-17804]|uniref:Membrane insertase YidC/Oxa/ALB C-terminal domain-containing protein n=1 Tax=Saitoella complicata (strain BCRC 22490 / CBS 7301 / JCM 7358 / NBRC 10748 / NRRL Y-17804) TaxID=698492 RepID=A0A0E9NH30_SAICN|nr:uncharacterized protein SAICODRAFT_90570 [Saitoella complicata NRRL Y-17804]ODQ54121.1 hypothetical protein SAICODRAFT_90570 [Saitoella complicata NRRL Y-17804]GAO49192.1 hypothetical protein G7K_3350-t1 [Saitoella complicata NRRL Y-17804]